MSVPWRWASGICANARSSTVDVVGGGVRPGLPGAQQPGQGLAGGVEEAQQRVVAERLLPGLGSRVPSREWQITIVASTSSTRPGDRVPGHRRGRPAGRSRPACAHATSRARARAARSRASAASSRPLSSRHAVGVRRDRAEQFGLTAQHRQVGDRLTAVGEHHRHIHRDPARIMPRSPLPQRRQRLRHRRGQAGRVGQIGQQPSAGVADHATPIRA